MEGEVAVVKFSYRVTVVPVEPEVGGNPNIPLAILHNIIHIRV